jgi:restriction endonuclease S subunit
MYKDFLLFFMGSTPFSEQLIARSTGTAQFNISPQSVGGVSVGLPTLLEQQTIAAFLDRETVKIDALIAKIFEAIARLKEYRTALISAAVTGKIDVREEVA